MSCGCTTWLHWAAWCKKHGLPSQTYVCSGLWQLRGAVGVKTKTYNMSSMIKFNKWKSVENRGCSLSMQSFGLVISLELKLLRWQWWNFVVVIVSCVFSCVWHVNTWLGKCSDYSAVLCTWNFPPRSHSSSAVPTVMRSHSHLLFYLCWEIPQKKPSFIIISCLGSEFFPLKHDFYCSAHYFCHASASHTAGIFLKGSYSIFISCGCWSLQLQHSQTILWSVGQ